MRHFWNWVKNDDETRTLYLEGVIAEESWFSDDITPAMFKEELFSGNGPITLHINSPGGDRRRLHRCQSDLHHAHGLSRRRHRADRRHGGFCCFRHRHGRHQGVHEPDQYDDDP